MLRGVDDLAAIALGLGTTIGWKRIVITVGEKIGKSHLTYAQGASAELVAAATIGAADVFGLPGLDHARAVGQPLCVVLALVLRSSDTTQKKARGSTGLLPWRYAKPDFTPPACSQRA
jgi:hypothetical protein